jgi:hypothetical protein
MTLQSTRFRAWRGASGGPRPAMSSPRSRPPGRPGVRSSSSCRRHRPRARVRAYWSRKPDALSRRRRPWLRRGWRAVSPRTQQPHRPNGGRDHRRRRLSPGAGLFWAAGVFDRRACAARDRRHQCAPITRPTSPRCRCGSDTPTSRPHASTITGVRPTFKVAY